MRYAPHMIKDVNPRDARSELGALRKLLHEDARNPVILRQCARLALDLREYDAVLQFATSALAAVPGDAEASFHQASALIGLKRYAEAIRTLSDLRSRNAGQPATDMNLALCHYALGAYAAARPLLDDLSASGSQSTDVIRLSVSTLHHLGDLTAAVATAESRSEAGLRDATVAGVYALVYLDAGNATAAGRYAQRALAGIPDSIDGLTVEATLRLAKLETAAAEKQFRRVLELAADNGRAWVGLGTIALLAEDLPRATECLERGVAAMPAHVGSWQVLGWTHLLSGNLDAAERIFQRSLEMDRNFGEAHGAIASIYALRGRLLEAREEIAIAERLDREGLAARFASAVLLGRAGDPQAARALIRTTAAGLAPRLGGRAARLLAKISNPPTRH
jgi:tetratricopeptide (TPR) repeat protein